MHLGRVIVALVRDCSNIVLSRLLKLNIVTRIEKLQKNFIQRERKRERGIIM